MQGAAPIFDGYPPRREAYLARTSQRRTHRDDGYPAQQRCRWAFFSGLLGVFGALGRGVGESFLAKRFQFVVQTPKADPQEFRRARPVALYVP